MYLLWGIGHLVKWKIFGLEGEENKDVRPTTNDDNHEGAHEEVEDDGDEDGLDREEVERPCACS